MSDHDVVYESNDIRMLGEVIGTSWIGRCTCGVSVYGGASEAGAQAEMARYHAERRDV